MSPKESVSSQASTANADVIRQHVVSRVILKRFAAMPPHKRAGTLEITNLSRLDAKSTFRGPFACGRIDNFVTYASSTLENVWQTVENRLHEAISACEDGSALNHPRHIQTLKRAIALHFVRSVHSRAHLDKIWREFLPRFRQTVLAARGDQLKAAFFGRYGLHPAGDEALEIVLDKMLERQLELREKGAHLRESLERLFNRASDELEPFGLEVSRTRSGEFVISDAPAVAVANDGRLGLRQGVGIASAATVALPLGPSLMVSTGPENALIELDDEHVDKMNLWQIRSALQYAYCRPGSDLGATIRLLRSQAIETNNG